MATATVKKNTARKHAGIKAMRQTAKRTGLNKMRLQEIDKNLRLLTIALKDKNKERANELHKKLQQIYAKAAKRGILHKNQAARGTSALAKRINKEVAA